jgi:tetratricopeptide (TPR) repeat protein
MDEGEAFAKASLVEWKRLAADYPANPLYRERIADWHLKNSVLYHQQHQANPAQAVRQLREGLQLLDELERDFPKHRIDNFLRAKGQGSLGYYLTLLSQYDEAEVHYRESLELNENSQHTRLLAQLLLMRGALDEALEVVQKGIENYQRQSDEHPDAFSVSDQLSKHLEVLAFILMAADRFSDAEEAARRMLEIDTEWYERFPDDDFYRLGFAWAKYELGNVLIGAGKHEEGVDAFRLSITHFEALAEQFPNLPRHQSHLGWVLSTCAAKELRNPNRAVHYAQRALSLTPENPDYWANLARAQFEAGDYRAAIVSTEEGRKYFGDRLPSDAKLVLAMAHHQLGDSLRGREIYRETVDELDNKKTYSEWYKTEFRVLRADADQLFAATPVRTEKLMTEK